MPPVKSLAHHCLGRCARSRRRFLYLSAESRVSQRTCEAVLERVAEWADMGWWIYPHAASTANNVADGDRAPPSLLSGAASQLGLCRTRLTAAAATLEDPSDLLHYDLICCVDYATLEHVRALAQQVDAEAMAAQPDAPEGSADRAVDSVDARLLCLTDFLAFQSASVDRMEALDQEMLELIAPHYSFATTLTELPNTLPSDDDPDAWEASLAAVALSCAGITSMIKERCDCYFEDTFKELLMAYFPTAERLVDWAQAEEMLRSHISTGGLTPELRETLFKEHRARLQQSQRGDELPEPD